MRARDSPRQQTRDVVHGLVPGLSLDGLSRNNVGLADSLSRNNADLADGLLFGLSSGPLAPGGDSLEISPRKMSLGDEALHCSATREAPVFLGQAEGLG